MSVKIYTDINSFSREIFNSDDVLVELKTNHRVYIPVSKITLIER